MDEQERKFLEGMEKRRADEAKERDKSWKEDIEKIEERHERRLAAHSKGFREDLGKIHEKMNAQNTKLEVIVASKCPDVTEHEKKHHKQPSDVMVHEGKYHDPVKKLKTVGVVISVVTGGSFLIWGLYQILSSIPHP